MSVADAANSKPGPRGLGGWLMLPILGLVVWPVVGVIQYIEAGDVFAAEIWRQVPTSSTSSRTPRSLNSFDVKLDADGSRDMVRGLVNLVVWVPYFLVRNA